MTLFYARMISTTVVRSKLSMDLAKILMGYVGEDCRNVDLFMKCQGN